MKIKKLSIFLGVFAVGLALSTTTASAAFITGSISFSDGFDTLPPPPTTSIVSGLTAFDIANPIQVNGPTGDFAGTTAATAYDFDIIALPTNFFDTDTGFNFLLTGAVTGSTSPLNCVGGLCTDDIQLNVTGIVSGAGFDDTLFLGSWTANATCLGADGLCDSDVTGSWSASLTATGQEVPTVPVPATLALIGLGLIGIGYKRRK